MNAPKHTDLPPRLAAKIRVEPNGCWIWTGYISRRSATGGHGGYGRARYEGRIWQAHRLIYTLLVGPISDDLEPDHTCRNRACVNPACLEPVTHAENMARGARARRDRCKRGHAFTPENTYRPPNSNERVCRTCQRENRRLRQQRDQGVVTAVT